MNRDTSAEADLQLAGDLAELLASGPELDGESTGHLQARLADAADERSLLDVAYRTLDSPVGPLLLAATEDGLVRVAFAGEGHDAVLTRLAILISPRILEAPRRLDGAARELEEYFEGKRRAFDLDLDFRLVRGFRRAVLDHLTAVAYGATASYTAVAAAAGNPRAVRAVGTACATNPLPLVIPCHRVVRSDGSLGQYGGGTEAKRTLLALEASGESPAG